MTSFSYESHKQGPFGVLTIATPSRSIKMRRAVGELQVTSCWCLQLAHCGQLYLPHQLVSRIQQGEGLEDVNAVVH